MTRRIGRGARLGVVVLAVGALGGAGAACSRCTELGPCTTQAPRVSFTVQMVEHLTGGPARGVHVRFVRTAGMLISQRGFGQDTIEGVSNVSGFVALTADANGVGYLTGDFTVIPPAPLAPYQVLAQVTEATRTYGGGRYLGQWAVVPYIDFVGEIGNYQTGVLVANARVTFVRTSGLPMTSDTLTATTDVSGRFFLRAPLTPSAGAGAVVGDLVVQAATLPKVVRFTNVSLATMYVNRTPLLGGRFDVAPLLAAAASQAASTPTRVHDAG